MKQLKKKIKKIQSSIKTRRTHYPCINCYKVLVAGGIKEIYYLEDYKNNTVVEEINKNLDIKIVKL